MSQKDRMLFLLLGVIASAFGGALITAVLPQAVAQDSKAEKKAVHASRFELVDANGKSRAALTLDKDNNLALILYDNNGAAVPAGGAFVSTPPGQNPHVEGILKVKGVQVVDDEGRELMFLGGKYTRPGDPTYWGLFLHGIEGRGPGSLEISYHPTSGMGPQGPQIHLDSGKATARMIAEEGRAQIKFEGTTVTSNRPQVGMELDGNTGNFWVAGKTTWRAVEK
jgi:hypothetical protein